MEQFEEELIVYTKDRKVIGRVKKANYSRLKGKKLCIDGKEVEPWVDCVTCFIIDKKTNDVAVQLRGLDEIDPGELDLCSGHVRAGEVPRLTMARELQEEMKMEGYTKEALSENLKFCGKVNMDFTQGENKKGKSLRCFASCYALMVEDKECVKANEAAVMRVGWMNFEKIKNQMRNSGFRFPYTEENSENYERIFDNVSKVIEGKENQIEATTLQDVERSF